MIQVQLKLRMTKAQERDCERWLFHLASVYNWAIRKIELNAKDRIYFSQLAFQNLLSGHSAKLGIPSHVLQGTLRTAFDAWKRCFSKQTCKPRFKGQRNRLNSISFIDPIRPPKGNRVNLLGLGSVRFHRQEIPEAKIKCARLCKRASGWHLCLFIDTNPQSIKRVGNGLVGIDPGFKSLLTLSTGEQISHPRELERTESRLAQAQRGNRRHLAARLQERISNQRKDRNHKLSRRLVAENIKIVFSADSIQSIARRFGKSVASSGHYQLRRMLSYKAAYSGCEYVEVDSKGSTKTCSECGSLSGPAGFAGLSVRSWKCACGARHERDVNAARNTLKAAAGCAVEVRNLAG